jgi:UDPglucose--hexose-1-phosphate uridylyltransferase
MELRKDPITRSWVITGDDVPDHAPRVEGFCRFCGDSPVAAQVVSNMPGVEGGAWSARAVVHPAPLYRVEGEPTRRGDGIYDRMSSVGAHEVLVENPRHDRQLWNASDAEIEHFLLLAAHRIQDLKRDARFKYVSIFKNH